jgi:hypothetical protein
VAIAAMMGVAAYLAMRNMPLAVIASVAPLCRHASLALEFKGFGNQAPSAPRTRVHEALVGSIAVALALSTGLFSRNLPDGFAQPRGAVEFMRANRLRGNVLGDFGWGEHLIFHLAPACKVFIDSRYDMVYPQNVLEDYFDFFFDGPRAAAVLDGYPHDFVLIPPRAPVRELMERRRDWKLIYSDPTALLFARADAPAVHLYGVPIRGRPPPNTFP